MRMRSRRLSKNYNNSSCGGADALTSLLLPYRSLRICSVVAPRHRIRRAHNLQCRSFSTGSWRKALVAGGANRGKALTSVAPFILYTEMGEERPNKRKFAGDRCSIEG